MKIKANLKIDRKLDSPQTRKLLAIDPFKKHPGDKITIILFGEGEAVVPREHIIIGGLNSWEMSTQHMTRVGDDRILNNLRSA